MKLKLIKNEEKKTVGYTLEAETKEEKLTMGTLRNMFFWGDGDEKPVYDGHNSEEADEGHYVTKLHFVTKKYKKERNDKFGTNHLQYPEP
jgi:hypothetical protein